MGTERSGLLTLRLKSTVSFTLLSSTSFSPSAMPFVTLARDRRFLRCRRLMHHAVLITMSTRTPATAPSHTQMQTSQLS